MWKTISSKEIFNHPRITLIEDEVVLPSGHKTKYLRYKENGDCVVTIIATKKDKILLQKEFSYPVNQKLFQFPGGGVSVEENPENGANRELSEEMGYKANKLELLGTHLFNNRRSAMKVFVYLATDLVEHIVPADPEEDIEGFWYSENEISEMIKNGEIINIYTLAAWCIYKSR